jgi:hypothetical protein
MMVPAKFCLTIADDECPPGGEQLDEIGSAGVRAAGQIIEAVIQGARTTPGTVTDGADQGVERSSTELRQTVRQIVRRSSADVTRSDTHPAAGDR